MSRTALAAAGLAAALSLVAAPFASAADDPLAELCAATGVEQVDTVLAGLDTDDLAGPLAPLLTLVVPDTEGGFVLQADVTSNDVREALDCAPANPDPTTEPEPTTEPTTEPTPDPPEPTTEPEPEPSTEPDPVLVDRDCTDFATQADAQAAYDRARTADVADPLRLDADGDGIACELEVDPIADDGSVADLGGDQVTVVPEGSADTGSA